MQSHDQEVFNKVDFVEESGADFGDAVAEESDTEEAQEGTDDSTYETEEEPTTETESEDEGHLNTSQYKRLVWPVLHEQLSQKPYDITEKFGFTLISTSIDCWVLSKQISMRGIKFCFILVFFFSWLGNTKMINKYNLLKMMNKMPNRCLCIHLVTGSQ